jgi:hypothetical protein
MFLLSPIGTVQHIPPRKPYCLVQARRSVAENTRIGIPEPLLIPLIRPRSSDRIAHSRFEQDRQDKVVVMEARHPPWIDNKKERSRT